MWNLRHDLVGRMGCFLELSSLDLIFCKDTSAELTVSSKEMSSKAASGPAGSHRRARLSRELVYVEIFICAYPELRYLLSDCCISH